jgi:hypothetical protein
MRLVVLLASVCALAACQKPDVGARCTLTWMVNGGTKPPTPATAAGDYFESGNVACDDLICIVSPSPAGSRYGACVDEPNYAGCGYCSKPCVSNKDCYSSSTGLVCDQIVLDPAFLATLDPATKQRYLGEISFSSYCVVPR